MFEHAWVDGLDAGRVTEALVAAHADLVEVETRQLVLAAAWLDVNAPCPEPDAGASGPSSGRVPGGERAVRPGADGTPEIDEFAVAEFAALQEMHPIAGANLLGKVANLRHRHPRLWARVHAGEVRGWKALETARIVGKREYGLTREQARVVDADTFEWISTLPWGQFLELLEARIIAADPDAAEARARAAAAKRFVATGRSSEYGLKTLIVRASAGDVVLFTAACERIAQVLAERGDTDPADARRARAIGILASPAHALALLTGADQPGSDRPDAVEDSGGSHGPGDPGPEPDPHREPEDGGPLRPGDLHPAEDDADDAVHDTPDPVRRPCPGCGGAGTRPFDPASGAEAFLRRGAGGAAPPGGLTADVLDRLRPTATLYVHVDRESFIAGRGVAHVEGLGPITIGQAQAFLGHRRVRVTEVIDLADRHPATGYAFRGRTREAVHLLSPRDVFPYGVSTSRRVDIDHPVPYLPPDAGGPPGQTHTGNAAPMIRFHHRVKTHGRWRLRQPEPGVHLWRSPHGWYFLTDHTGTRRLPRHTGEMLWHALDQGSRTGAA